MQNTAASPVLVLPENTAGRDFVVGDIHGTFDLLDAALKAVDFDPAVDRVICVGDLINRGMRSRDCLDYLAQPWFFSVRGNHEQIFIDIYDKGTLQDPANAAKAGPDFAWIFNESAGMHAKMRAAFEQMPYAIEIQTAQGPVGCVHANVPAGLNWKKFKAKLLSGDKDTRNAALWNRDRIYDADTSGVADAFRVYFGHTIVPDYPRVLGNCCFIDTGAVYKATGQNSKDDLFFSIIEIGAAAADIRTPVKTQDALVRKVMARKAQP